MKIIGKKAIIDAIKNNKTIIKVFLLSNKNDFFKYLNEKNIRIEIKNKSFFDIYENVNHQFAIAEIEDHSFNKTLEEIASNSSKDSIIVVLDEINDPRNFGAILRTCEAFGVDAIIYKKNNQVQINDLVIKTSMGATSSLNLFKVTNLMNEIEKLKKFGYWVVSSSLDGSIDVNCQDFEFKTILVIGNENNGVSKLIQKKSDYKVKIPMYGKVQSLNVSVATGILLNAIRNNKK